MAALFPMMLSGATSSLVGGLVGNKLFGKEKKTKSASKGADTKARKIAQAKADSLRPSTYQGNTTPVSTLLSGPGRSGY